MRRTTDNSLYATRGGQTEPVGASEFTPVGSVLGGVLKEIARRVELRQRLEGEQGVPISDEAFLEIAESTGGVRL
ncbi:MAG TPA: hypothetical protein PK614_03560 [Nitrospira sp.]|nr:hypothetical protein [Nitrospira sp.]